MQVKSLNLLNFRNYKNLKIDFDEKLNILVGKNAQGKTNIIEAIFYCCIGKSFKGTKDKDMIKWNENNSYIKMDLQKKFRDLKIEVLFSQSSKKSVKIDGINIHKIGELIGEINVIFFSPDELKLVKESPDERRKFMDIDLSQTHKKYFYLLNRYEKVLANRNRLLKMTKDINVLKDTIDIWDRALVEYAEQITLQRAKFIEDILPYAQMAHSYISNGSEVLDIKYKSGTKIDDFENFKEKMDKLLKQNIEKDFRLGYTTVGPHRDDLDIFVNDVEVKNFGSQGQQRTVALSLKLAELETMKSIKGEYPILLLDDVFSELDSDRKKRLLKFVSRTQTFITCTDLFNFDCGKVYTIKNGEIENIENNI